VLRNRRDGTLIPIYPFWSNDSKTIYFNGLDIQVRSSIWSIPVTGWDSKTFGHVE